MNKVFLISNLKSYKTENEAKLWLDSFSKIKQPKIDLANKEIIVCPSFTLLQFFNSYKTSNNLPIKIGAQNVSPFEEGAYTGEVNARQIKDFADYVLVGHSERRISFNENDEMLSKKVDLALKYNLTPVFLIQGEDTPIPKGVEIIAYEPIFAIGSGTPDTPENADSVAVSVKLKGNNYNILYGGSVSSQNVRSFTEKESISGVLVGGASLEAEEFIKIVQNA